LAQRSNFRGLTLILLPLIMSACLSIYLVRSYTTSVLTQQADQFGQAVTEHMANSVADHLVNDDRLSLNVLLTDLLAKENFDTASVYNIDNDLVAQVGRSANITLTTTNITFFTKDVTSQNVITGHVRLGFDRSYLDSAVNRTLNISIALHLLAVLLVWFLGTFYGDLFYLWMMHKSPAKSAAKANTQDIIEPPLLPEATLLAVKLRPTRFLEQYKYKVQSAHALYGGMQHRGEFEETENGDIVICFRDNEQLAHAMYTGLLILALFKNVDAPITLKLGIHTVKDQSISGELEKARKHTSYLASISDNQLLAIRLVRNLVDLSSNSDQFDQEAFHGSMAPEGEVFSVAAKDCKDLIENQADQILNQ